MKKLGLLLALCLTTSLSALAADWSIIPLPKDSDNLTIPNFIDALKELKSAGSPVMVSLNGWNELEPSPNRLATDHILGGIEYGIKTHGFTPYFGITLINTTTRDMPSDLRNISWDAPEMLQRFATLLDATADKVPASLPVLIIGNEVDVYFESHPDEVDAYLAFFKKAQALARQHYPQAKIGITVTYEGLLKDSRRQIIGKMVDASDAAFFTFYPFFNLKPEPLDSIPAHLDQLIAAAQGKPVYLQEIGFPSATSLGSSESMQAEFFAVAIPAVNARPQIVQANVFVQHDLGPKLCSGLIDYYGFGSLPAELGQKFSDFLCSLGVRYADGNLKPAWGVISAHLSQH